MKFQPIDQFATTLPPEKRQSVYGGTKATHEKRAKLLAAQFAEPDQLRRLAGEIKQHAIENLDTLLPLAEESLGRNMPLPHLGAQVRPLLEAKSEKEPIQ